MHEQWQKRCAKLVAVPEYNKKKSWQTSGKAARAPLAGKGQALKVRGSNLEPSISNSSISGTPCLVPLVHRLLVLDIMRGQIMKSSSY